MILISILVVMLTVLLSFVLKTLLKLLRSYLNSRLEKLAKKEAQAQKNLRKSVDGDKNESKNSSSLNTAGLVARVLMLKALVKGLSFTLILVTWLFRGISVIVTSFGLVVSILSVGALISSVLAITVLSDAKFSDKIDSGTPTSSVSSISCGGIDLSKYKGNAKSQTEGKNNALILGKVMMCTPVKANSNKPLNAKQSAGILANLYHETSTFNTRLIQQGSWSPPKGRLATNDEMLSLAKSQTGSSQNAVGIMQWRQDRLEKMVKLAKREGKEWHNPEVQIKYLLWEFDNNNRGLSSTGFFKQADTASVTMFTHWYNRKMVGSCRLVIPSDNTGCGESYGVNWHTIGEQSAKRAEQYYNMLK